MDIIILVGSPERTRTLPLPVPFRSSTSSPSWSPWPSAHPFRSVLKAAISHKRIRGRDGFTSNAPADEKKAYDLEVLPAESISLKIRSR